MKANPILIETTVTADLKKAWDYWTLPRHIVNWNFASDDWHCPNAANDLQSGGKFNYRMAAKDGSFGFDFEGMYDEVIPHQKISYSLADGRQCVIEFKNVGDTTTVTETFDPEKTNSEELQRNGWQAILNNYKKYVEANDEH